MEGVMADRPTTERQVALFALNGWACYATRKIEHDDIARLHKELQAINGVEDETNQSAMVDVCAECGLARTNHPPECGPFVPREPADPPAQTPDRPFTPEQVESFKELVSTTISDGKGGRIRLADVLDAYAHSLRVAETAQKEQT